MITTSVSEKVINSMSEKFFHRLLSPSPSLLLQRLTPVIAITSTIIFKLYLQFAIVVMTYY